MGSILLAEGAKGAIRSDFIIGTVAAVAGLLIILQFFAALQRRWLHAAKTPRALRAEARRHARRGEHRRAGELFRAAGEDDLAIEEFRQAGLAHKAAEVLYARGRFSAAAALWERAEVYEPAAEAYQRAGELKRAEANYAKAGKRILAARMYEEAGETLKAANIYREIQKLDRAAELFDKLGKKADACDLWEKIYFVAAAGLRAPLSGIKKDDVVELEAKVVAVRRETRDLERLLSFYVRAGLFVKAGELALEMGALEKAIELFIRAGREDRAATILESRGDTLRAARIRGEMALRQDELRSAVRHFEAAGEMRLAAEVWERLGEEVRAAEAYEKAGDPRQAAFLYARKGMYERAAELYDVSGDLDAALRCYETLKDHPKRAAILVRAGRLVRAGEVYIKMGNLEEAIAVLQRIGPNEKDGPAAAALLGIAFLEKGSPKLALEKLDEAIAATGGSTPYVPATEIHYARGRCLEALGETARAAAEYERVIAIDYDFRDAADRLAALQASGERAKVEREPLAKTAVHGQSGAAEGAPVAVATPPNGRDSGSGERRDGSPPTRAFTRPSGREPPAKLGEGRYKILEEIGRGGMGVVYKCEDTLLGRIVAYKVLSSQIRDFPAALENFLREAKSAARLNHPNIVTIYDFGESDGGYYMTLEYVAGKTLRQFLKAGPDSERIRTVLLGICDGLAYAHSQNVVHRDVKPSNILISELDMKAKILDFGLAKVMEDVSQTASGVLGTPWYMSPEQVLGASIDQRTDIYSLGVTLFEVMTGELPFRGRDFGYHHVHTLPPSPRSVNPRVTVDLDAIILKCLQKKPEDRFQTAEEVRDAVRLAQL